MSLYIAVYLMRFVMWLMGWRGLVVHLSKDQEFVTGMTIGDDVLVDRVDRMLDARGE